MNLQDFETQIADFEISKGFSIYKNNILAECKEVGTGKWNAIVRGSDYGIKIEVKEGAIANSSCTCPEGKTFCKHKIATLFVIKYGPYDANVEYNIPSATAAPKKLQTPKAPKIPKTPKATFPDLVRKVSLEELQNFIIEYAQSGRELRNTFQAYFVDKSDGGISHYLSIMDDAANIAAKKTQRGYIDAYHSKIAFRPVIMLLDTADKKLLEEQYQVAADIAHAVIEYVQVLLDDQMDDSYGESTKSFVRAFKLLEQVHGPKVPLDIKEDIFEDSISTAFEQDYSSYGIDGDWMKYLEPLINTAQRKKKLTSAINSCIEEYKKVGSAKENKLKHLTNRWSAYLKNP